MERITVAVRNRVVQAASPPYFSTMIPIFSNKVGDFVREVAQSPT